MKILFFGDIFGRPGRNAVKSFLTENKVKLGIDLVIANVDNVASGRGPTKKTYQEMLDAGVDVMTGGDHVWDQKESIEIVSDKNSKLIRPLNHNKICPGRGSIELNIKGKDIVVATFLGRVWTSEGLESPFDKADELIETLKNKPLIIDFHAEATSEKVAFGNYLSGRASAVLGTHTHVQTADNKIIDGTAYISDVGFCGPTDSIIGVDKNQSIKRFRSGMPQKFDVAEDPSQINAVVITLNEDGSAESIERINQIVY